MKKHTHKLKIKRDPHKTIAYGINTYKYVNIYKNFSLPRRDNVEYGIKLTNFVCDVNFIKTYYGTLIYKDDELNNIDTIELSFKEFIENYNYIFYPIADTWFYKYQYKNNWVFKIMKPKTIR